MKGREKKVSTKIRQNWNYWSYYGDWAICGITQDQSKCKQGKSWGICSKGIIWGTLTGLLKIPFELQYYRKGKGNDNQNDSSR